MKVVNRSIDSTEYHQLLDLLHNAYQSDLNLGIQFKAATIDYSNLVAQLKSMRTFVSVIDDEIVATVSVRLPWSINPGPYQIPHLGWVATNPNYLKRGLSSQLIEWVETNYVQNELHTPAVSLGTAVEHPWLKQFYQRIGYQPVETRRKYADHLTIFMVKTLYSTILNNSSRLNQLGLKQLYEGELNNEL